MVYISNRDFNNAVPSDYILLYTFITKNMLLRVNSILRIDDMKPSSPSSPKDNTLKTNSVEHGVYLVYQ